MLFWVCFRINAIVDSSYKNINGNRLFLKFVYLGKDFSITLIHGICGTEAEIFGKVPQIPCDEGGAAQRAAVCVSEPADFTQPDSSAVIFPKKKEKSIIFAAFFHGLNAA